jgi:ATP-binding cassette subfamily B protein
VLDGGRLIEEGTGEELIARNGLFARLYKIQQESMGWTVKK